MSNRRKLLFALGTSTLAATALMGYLIWSGYREAIHTAETTSRNYAAIIEARLDATLRRADADLLELARELPVAALSKQEVPRYDRELDARLDLRLLNFPELLGLRVFDVDGDLIYASGGKTTPRINVVDRDYFRLLRDGPHNDPVFSEVVTGRSVGRQIVLVARALRDGQAAFRGIVTASIDLEYFQTLFQSLDLGAHGVVAIYRSDNFTLVTRWPRGDNKLNTPLSKGSPIHMAMTSGKRTMTFATSSNVDGMVRVYSNHVLERYPFFASTGIAREDVLAGWRDRTLEVVLSGLVLLGLLASSLYRLERAEARQAQVMTNLAESEHRYRDLVATIPGAVYEFRVDSTGRRSMPFVSKGIVELTGLSPEEIQADVEVVFRQVPAAAMPVMEQSIRDSLENLTPWLHKFPLQTTTGEDKWLRGHAIPRREADGSTRWHGVFSDITARVAAQKALQESQARLASIIGSVRDAIITVDETGSILVFNRAAETMFRCNAADAVGQSLERFIPQRFHAAHRDHVRKFGATTGASARAMGPAGDVIGLRADGKEFPVEAAISHVTVGGRRLFTVMLRDIVGRIAAAEKQRDVLVKEVHHRIKNNLQGVIGLMPG